MPCYQETNFWFRHLSWNHSCVWQQDTSYNSHRLNYQFTTLNNYRRGLVNDRCNSIVTQCQPAGHLQLERLQPRAMPSLPATPQYTKLYIALTFENYYFLIPGHDDATTISLFYTTATAEPATPFLPLHSLPGKLHEPAYNRLQMMHSAADAQLWHYYSLTELHTTTNHIGDYVLVTIALPTVYIQQLLKDNSLDYFIRIHREQLHPTSQLPPSGATHQLHLQRLRATLHPV